MKVVLFGATGGIGKWVLKHALDEGHEVTAFVRNPKKIALQHEKLKIFQGQVNPYTRKVNVGFGEKHIGMAISREDIGVFMVSQLNSNEYILQMPIVGS